VGNKASLALNVRVESSVYSQNRSLATFFALYKAKDETATTLEVTTFSLPLMP
jgi:hypothetical protein